MSLSMAAFAGALSHMEPVSTEKFPRNSAHLISQKSFDVPISGF
jgi:hypothetical protein